MNKSALKTFATSARRELLKKIEAKAMKIGITEETIKKADIESTDATFIGGEQLSREENIQRNKLIARINQIGYKQVLEEVAYTWFNRFTALRFMEVNDYLPTGVRVLSSLNLNSADPDMLNMALELDLEVDKEYIYELKMNNMTEELFKYLIIKHCNDLNKYLPFMFETIDDYTEILFPEAMLAKDSFIRQMTDIKFIPEQNWNKVEIIGWLYQFYISEEKDRVFKEKKKYKSEEIPFATQLFTPDWIVRYMVQNSLGRYWMESHPEHIDLLENWEFYIENKPSISDFEENFASFINKELKVEDIKCFDPAMGSGHILVYMFDVLYEIYSKCGYMEREIPKLIIENNLFGLDIDDRAYQLACFSVVMKALEYNSRFFRSIEREGLTLNLASIQETNIFREADFVFFAGEKTGENYDKIKGFINMYQDAKTLGSLIKVIEHDRNYLEERFLEIKGNPAKDLFEEEVRKRFIDFFPTLLSQFDIMVQKYDILVTNPPYMGSGNMNPVLTSFLKKEYADSKADLFASFMDIEQYLKSKGFYASINQHSWMFLSSFEKIREKVIENKSISTMLHLGSRAFEEIDGEVVQSTAFVLRNTKSFGYNGVYIRLVDYKTAKEKKERTLEAIRNPNVSYRYSFDQGNFRKVPGTPIAYWLLNITAFDNDKLKATYYSGGRNKTHNNEKYIRYFWEVSKSNSMWVSYLNGGEYKKYYGNDIFVVNWSDGAREFYSSHGGLVNPKFWNKEGITWNLITSSNPGFRIKEKSSQYSSGSPTIFNNEYLVDNLILGFLNSKVSQYLLKIINPTINTTVGDVLSLPIISLSNESMNLINCLVEENITISKKDWDSFEISRNFQQHPLMIYNSNAIQSAYKRLESQKQSEYNHLKKNEEEINRVFIEKYGLQNVLVPEVENKDITISKANLEREIKSFISYAVGCILGRYSLDDEGLIYAGGEFNADNYKTIKVDKDNILPILPGAYFEDDIVSRFIEFVKVTFGTTNLTNNLEFITDTLGKKKGETAKETIRRYFLNDFFKDHVQTYKKRPIYWLFSSGKQKAFNCLIYMHRYDKTTLSRIRIDYLHEYQIRLDAEKEELLTIIEGDYPTKEISNAKKELKVLDRKIEELKDYDELLHHMADMHIDIDLNDGVAINYEKFNGLVAKI